MGRLLSALAASLDASRREWIVVGWLLVLALASIGQWWFFWGLRQATWTPVGFLIALSLPGALLVQVWLLAGDNPGSVTSFGERFFERSDRPSTANLLA